MATRSPDNKTGNLWLTLLVFLVIFLLLIPSYGVVFGPLQMAKRTAAWANLRSIVMAYQNSTIGAPSPHPYAANPGANVHELAYALALSSDPKEASMWVVKSDQANAGLNIPNNIITGDTTGKAMDPEFAKLTLAYEFVANVPLNSSPNTTPIAWTRGLQADGTWDANSPWKGAGGHIAFLDGHIQWYGPRLGLEFVGNTPPLVKFGANVPTVNIREALPPGAVVLSAEPMGAQK